MPGARGRDSGCASRAAYRDSSAPVAIDKRGIAEAGGVYSFDARTSDENRPREQADKPDGHRILSHSGAKVARQNATTNVGQDWISLCDNAIRSSGGRYSKCLMCAGVKNPVAPLRPSKNPRA